MPLTKQWLVLAASAFQCMRVRVFCAPNVTIMLVYIPGKIKISFIWKDDFFFFGKIVIFCKSIAGPLSEAKTHWMGNWLQLLNQLNFIWRHIKVFMQNSSQWCLRNVQLLRTTVNLCWRFFTHTFCHSSNILGCTHCFWLFTVWFIILIDKVFTLLSQDNDHTELTVIFFFQNPYAIFAPILQHYDAVV